MLKTISSSKTKTIFLTLTVNATQQSKSEDSNTESQTYLEGGEFSDGVFVSDHYLYDDTSKIEHPDSSNIENFYISETSHKAEFLSDTKAECIKESSQDIDWLELAAMFTALLGRTAILGSSDRNWTQVFSFFNYKKFRRNSSEYVDEDGIYMNIFDNHEDSMKIKEWIKKLYEQNKIKNNKVKKKLRF